jgi:hypothetical protein
MASSCLELHAHRGDMPAPPFVPRAVGRYDKLVIRLEAGTFRLDDLVEISREWRESVDLMNSSAVVKEVESAVWTQ